MYKYGLGNAHPVVCRTTAVTPRFSNVSVTLTLRIYYYYFLHTFLFLFKSKFINFVHGVTDALHISFFFSTLKSSVTDFGYNFCCSQTECPSLLPLGPRTVYSPRRYVPPFAARHHVRIHGLNV
jgi:hypothetical protein